MSCNCTDFFNCEHKFGLLDFRFKHPANMLLSTVQPSATITSQTDKNYMRASHSMHRSHVGEDDDDDAHASRRDVTNAARVKMKADTSRTKNFAPGDICVVCEDTASGIHYGVTACNGCKTFFRRVVLENRTYSCKNNGDCIIDKDKRCSCRHCRYKKCIRVGMDRDDLNLERRRKRKSNGAGAGLDDITDATISDPLLELLVDKENRYQALVRSSLMEIHTSLKDALNTDYCAFDNAFTKYAQHPMAPGHHTNFSYWRAKILSVLVEWAKSFEVFHKLSIEDRERLVVHTAFSNLVLAEAFNTPEKYTDRIVFPDGLSGFRNLSANILKERSGLIPTVVGVINNILVPIRRIKLTKTEYLLLQAIIFFDPECLSLSTMAAQLISAKRRRILESLRRHLGEKLKDPSEAAARFAAILLRIGNIQKVAAFKRETLATIETFDLMQPHPLTMEISKMYPDVSFF